jgi:hypothetical protein
MPEVRLPFASERDRNDGVIVVKKLTGLSVEGAPWKLIDEIRFRESGT